MLQVGVGFFIDDCFLMSPDSRAGCLEAGLRLENCESLPDTLVDGVFELRSHTRCVGPVESLVRKYPVRVPQIEEWGPVGIGEISSIPASLQKAMFEDFKIAGIRVALNSSGYTVQSRVSGVCSAGSHDPQTGLGRCEPDFPSHPPVPERRTGDWFATRSRKGRSDIDILKRVTISYRACECNFDSLPLLHLEIGSRRGWDTKHRIARENREGNCKNNFSRFAQKTGGR